MAEESRKTKKYDKNPELIAKYRNGDTLAGEELVKLNTPLVYSIATRYKDRDRDILDLVECGTLGLVKAIKTFDLDRGCAFSTYAVPLIFGEIRRFLRDDGILKVSREDRRLCAILNKERERRSVMGESLDIKSIAKSCGVSVEDASVAIFSEVPIRSFEESVFDEDSAVTLGNTLCNEDEEHFEFDKLALKVAIEGLSTVERKLVLLRYFRDYSQTETAKALGLSQVKVSREEKKIMEKLKKELTPT